MSGTATEVIEDWSVQAACREPGRPSPFPEDWGIGRHGLALRSQALSTCRACSVRRACGVSALAEYDRGDALYGIRCGIAFVDVNRTRQAKPIARLRKLVA